MEGRIRQSNEITKSILVTRLGVLGFIAAIIVQLTMLLVFSAPSTAEGSCGSGHGTSWGGDVGQGSIGANGGRDCAGRGAQGQAPDDPTIVSIVTIDCGTWQTQLRPECTPRLTCPDIEGRPAHWYVDYILRTDGKQYFDSEWCETAPPPVITALDVRGEAQKLLPLSRISSAPPPAPAGVPLVNVDVIYWIGDGTAYQPLGSATILGRQVDFQARIESVAWNFGDGVSGTSEGPGRAYDFDVNPCRTAHCPGYFTHAYSQKGPKAVTATATWFGQFRVDGGAWTDIGAVTAPTGAMTIDIREARSVLVDSNR